LNGDERLRAPAVQRNREPLADVLSQVLPERGLVLEIASGSGEHACHFAARLPGLIFQPSDPDERARRSIAAWIAHEGLENIRPALALDAGASEDWPLETFASPPLVCLLNINMIHISPWSACRGLLRGAERALSAGAKLVLYGPYRRGGRHTAPSNAAFDADLRSRNPDWGVRDLEKVVDCARDHGLRLERVIAMPANNLSVVFRRESKREASIGEPGATQ